MKALWWKKKKNKNKSKSKKKQEEEEEKEKRRKRRRRRRRRKEGEEEIIVKATEPGSFQAVDHAIRCSEAGAWLCDLSIRKQRPGADHSLYTMRTGMLEMSNCFIAVFSELKHSLLEGQGGP